MEANELADEALREVVRNGLIMSLHLPFKQIKLVDKETGTKAIGLLVTALFQVEK